MGDSTYIEGTEPTRTNRTQDKKDRTPAMTLTNEAPARSVNNQNNYSKYVTNYLDRRWEETQQEFERFEAKMKHANIPGQRAFCMTEYALVVIYSDYLQAEIKRISEITLGQLESQYIPTLMDYLNGYSPMNSTSTFHNASDQVYHEAQKEALKVARFVLEMSKD